MIPLFKIGIVLIRQVSKPVSGYIKKKAGDNKKFRSFCVYCGKKYYFFEQYIQKKFYNSNTTNVNYSSFITETKSVNVGCEILGESIIFFIAAVIIIAEYKRNSLKEAKKELILNHKLDVLRAQVKELQKENDEIMKIVMPDRTNIRDKTSFDLVHTNFFKDIYRRLIGLAVTSSREMKEKTQLETETETKTEAETETKTEAETKTNQPFIQTKKWSETKIEKDNQNKE